MKDAIRLGSNQNNAPRHQPVLKPYSGVGANVLQRNYKILIGAAITGLALPYGFFYAITTPWLLVPFTTPIALLLLLVIWTFPETRVVPERTIEGLTFACFITLALWPSYLAIDLPGLPWITIIRLVATPLVIILLISASTSRDFRSRFAEIHNSAPLVWKLLVALVVAQILSIPFSNHLGDSISKFVVFQTNQTALLLVTAYVFRKPGRVERYAALYWAFCVITSALAMVEFVEQKVLWVEHLPWFISIDEGVQKILNGSMRPNTGQYRSQAVFSTPLGFSEFLSFGLPLILHFASSGRYNPWVRGAAWLSIPLVLQAILASDSRLGILGFFLSTMLYLLVWALRTWRNNRHSLIAPTVLAGYPVLFALTIIASFTVGRIRSKVWGMGQYDNSTEARGDQIRAGIPKILSHPLGHGPGMASESLGFTNPSGSLTIDVGLLATALDYGILGFIFFYGIFVAAMIYAARHLIFSKVKNYEFTFAFPLCLSIFNFIAIKGVLAQEENHPIIFMIAGILVGLVHQGRQSANEQGERGTLARPASEKPRAPRPLAPRNLAARMGSIRS